jgi:hypothetical protein
MYDKKNSQDTFLSQEKVGFMGSHEKKAPPLWLSQWFLRF